MLDRDPMAALSALYPAWRRLRHVGSDSWDLFVASDERTSHVDEDRMDLAELRTAMEGHAAAWSSLLAQEPEPDAVTREVDEDDGLHAGYPMGIQLAQALHHGTDHRSHVCTALTSLGLEPPVIDVLAFGMQRGRVVEVQPRPDELLAGKRGEPVARRRS